YSPLNPRRASSPSPTQGRLAMEDGSEDRTKTDGGKEEPLFAALFKESASLVEFWKQNDSNVTQDYLELRAGALYKTVSSCENQFWEKEDIFYSSNEEPKPDQWQNLIELHRDLIHAYRDFFFATQHRCAGKKVKTLVGKNKMLQRITYHGILSLLQLPQSELPLSRAYMRKFIDISYEVLDSLYEAAPAFVDRWIELNIQLCERRNDIEIKIGNSNATTHWNGCTKLWYARAAGRNPTAGRLYCQLAALTPQEEFLQLFCRAKSLCVTQPDPAARERLLSLFDQILSSKSSGLHPDDAALVRSLGVLFSGRSAGPLEQSQTVLDAIHSERGPEPGYLSGIILSCLLFGCSSSSNPLRLAIAESRQGSKASTGMRYPGTNSAKPPVLEKPIGKNEADLEAVEAATFQKTLSFAVQMYEGVLSRQLADNTLPLGNTLSVGNSVSFLHTTSRFIFYLSKYPRAIAFIRKKFPWELMVRYLNSAIQKLKSEKGKDMRDPYPADVPHTPLPEDYAQLGLFYANEDLPPGWFTGEEIPLSLEVFAAFITIVPPLVHVSFLMLTEILDGLEVFAAFITLVPPLVRVFFLMLTEVLDGLKVFVAFVGIVRPLVYVRVVTHVLLAWLAADNEAIYECSFEAHGPGAWRIDEVVGSR
ncbi:hypothetical protein K4F52_010144, partial [Lecanicillium sp. MT-2017a]